MVGASFGLQSFTQTRYDLHRQKVTQVRTRPPYNFLFFTVPVRVFKSFLLYFQMSREQELGLDRNRKKFDAREEYFVSPLLFRLLSLSLFPRPWINF